MGTIASLYVHFPFCEARCHYCDFYSLGREKTKASDPEIFADALGREATLLAPLLAPRLDTIFFGGGTPSMTAPEVMKRTLEPLWAVAKTDAQTEWTMEANPSSLSPAHLREYRALGVNRISMGVQALETTLLQKLGRVHSRERALAALAEIFEAGFDNVSVDLLCGVPGQALEDIEAALEALTSFPITHLSCYLLTLAPHHKMHPELPGEDTQLEHLLFVDSQMRSRGFEHYEISNYARPGKRARHNLRYWTGESYLGLGPSAQSFDAQTATRSKNVSSLHRYGELLSQGKSPLEWTETLTPEQRELERWMLTLRLSDGFPKSWLTSSGREAKAGALAREGLLEGHPEAADRLRLTARGFALSDQVIRALT
jgi:oxygen-independent coproporphyrinogen-3 oxidase